MEAKLFVAMLFLVLLLVHKDSKGKSWNLDKNAVSLYLLAESAVGKKKDTEAAYYKINLEAAKEIAVQIRLRNLSGVILVDFIDMEEEKNTNALVSFFAEKLAKDPIKANFIDMTALHLAEITRKKVRKPLYEQIRLFQIHFVWMEKKDFLLLNYKEFLIKLQKFQGKLHISKNNVYENRKKW